MSINVGIADDHKLVCEGLKQLIEFDGNISVIFQAHDGMECLSYLKRPSTPIDVLLLDINMPVLDGFDVLKQAHIISPALKVIILTAYADMDFLSKCLDLGANGFILKDAGSSELIRAIEAVLSNQRYIQPSLIPLLNSHLVSKDIEQSKIDSLTGREMDVLILAAKGLLNKEIAVSLAISERTVKNHMTSIFKKINVTDRTQAAVFAIKNNLIKI